ncbi:MAG: polymerase subunit sigma-70 [Firmicutes bacterium]|nr:polymerase subunit sigma-70 [Bacillota bacterium]
MTLAQKEEIRKLRLQGLGYKSISQEMHISVDAVKGYCKRQILGPANAILINPPETKQSNAVCLHCNKPIQKRNRGRTKKFCSDDCRHTWWNKNQDQRKRNSIAMYSYTCVQCGKRGISYGNKQRKYCSHHCYIRNRFWRDEYGI